VHAGERLIGGSEACVARPAYPIYVAEKEASLAALVQKVYIYICPSVPYVRSKGPTLAPPSHPLHASPYTLAVAALRLPRRMTGVMNSTIDTDTTTAWIPKTTPVPSLAIHAGWK